MSDAPCLSVAILFHCVRESVFFVRDKLVSEPSKLTQRGHSGNDMFDLGIISLFTLNVTLSTEYSIVAAVIPSDAFGRLSSKMADDDINKKHFSYRSMRNSSITDSFCYMFN